MRVSRRAPRLRRAVGLGVAAVLASSGLAACGGAGSGLCAQARQVDRLVVTRFNPFPQNHDHFTFPAKVTVAEPGKARSAALAACALPDMPSGPMSCGSGDFGGWYTLRFTARGRHLPAVRVESGCEEVTGLGSERWVARTPGFWRVLGAAMGLPRAGMSTFLAPPSG